MTDHGQCLIFHVCTVCQLQVQHTRHFHPNRRERSAKHRWMHPSPCSFAIHSLVNKTSRRKWKRDRNKERQKHERASVAPPDRPSQAIHYSLNASQCQLYYCKAIPDWRPRVGGEKWQQNTAPYPGRKQGSGCDGWVCLTQAGWKAEMGPFQMRQGVSGVAAPLPRASQPCQDERHFAKLPLSVLLSLVSKQTLSIFNR